MTIWMPELAHRTGPRYKALADAIEEAIRTGELEGDQRLPTHRALADALEVTTGTITRAYAEAERRGLVYGVVGRGTFVRKPDTVVAAQWQFVETTEDEWIELNLNLPLKEDRAEMLADAMASLSNHPSDISQLLDYQPDIGIRAHRETIAHWLRRDDWHPTADQIVISNGGQHGLLVALMSLTRAGDTVLAEELTYPGFTHITRQLHLQIRPVGMDEEGVRPSDLEAACRQHAPRVLFCTPTLQNPTTGTMSLERRKAILEICDRYGVTVIEDDLSVGLAARSPLPLAALAPSRVVHVGAFSKTLAAGVRVGYVVVPSDLQSRFGASVRASCWMISPLMVAVVCEWIRSGSAERFIRDQRKELLARREIVLEKLKGYEVRSGPGGLHLWLNLPDPWRAEEFVAAAKERGVLVMGASTFSIGRTPVPHAVRISFSAVRSRTLMERGLDILVDLMKTGPEPGALIV